MQGPAPYKDPLGPPPTLPLSLNLLWLLLSGFPFTLEVLAAALATQNHTAYPSSTALAFR